MSAPAGRPRIALLPDSGPGVGLGHVSRCLALGRAAAAEGVRVLLLAGPEACAAALVRAAGVETIAVPDGVNGPAVIDRLAAMKPGIVVIDSYRASPVHLVALRSTPTHLVAVDDLADRPLPVDVVVNGGVAAERLPYRRVAGTRFLLGPRYALLDPRYAVPPLARARDRVRRVLVTLGGGRHEASLVTALAVLGQTLDDAHVDMAVGRDGAGPDLAAAVSASRLRVMLHTDTVGLRELIASADVAIAAAGMTLYELAAMATPTVMVAVADNQAPNLEAFGGAGAALSAGRADDRGLSASLRAALGRLAADGDLRRTLGARARALVDGQGAMRVAREIAAVVGQPAMTARVRIGDRWVADGEPCFVIAEAGANHNRDLAMGRELIDVAAEACAGALRAVGEALADGRIQERLRGKPYAEAFRRS